MTLHTKHGGQDGEAQTSVASWSPLTLDSGPLDKMFNEKNKPLFN